MSHRSIEQILTDTIEPLEPQDAFLRVLRKNDGKRFDKRLLNKLKALVPEEERNKVRDVRQYGMTHLEWGDYRRTDGGKGGSLLIAYGEKNVYINVAQIEERNVCYFGAAEGRNKLRRSLSNRHVAIKKLEKAIADYKAAKAALKKKLNTFSVVEYAIKKDFGLDF